MCSHLNKNLFLRSLRKKLLWQSRRRRKLSNESRLGQKRKLPKRLRKIELETNAKLMMMMKVNGDEKKKVIKQMCQFSVTGVTG